MPDTTAIRNLARLRASELKLTYAGALLPSEAYALMQNGAALVDVRTKAELEWVGRVPGSITIEWNFWPGGVANPGFLDQLQTQVGTDTAVMFLCRSGGRSHHAASAAARVGYQHAFNILQGFEGDKNPEGHRNTLSGWRVSGLPWLQS